MESNLHMLLFPFMAQGHMLPLIDIANIFAARGSRITIFTTPINASIIRHTIISTSVHLHIVPFPSAEFGLPDGCENRADVPSDDLRSNFYNAVGSLRDPFNAALRDLNPDCVISDMFLPWTHGLAAARGIPRLLFHGSGYFAHCAEHAFKNFCFEGAADSIKSFVLPGLPHRIEMLRTQVFDFRNLAGTTMDYMIEIMKEIAEVEPKSYGTVMNSFYELEPAYADMFRKEMGRRAWNIGPVSLSNHESANKLVRGGEQADSVDECLKWLDEKPSGSVVYICFGSTSFMSATQLTEIALGLEASGHPFVWVVRNADTEWVPEDYEERIRGRGMVIRRWAPQLLILNHEAIGGFVTHCGWNSSLEGISAGLPLVTWPLYAEQFFNEKLLVEVLRIGVAVGSKVYSFYKDEREVLMADAVEEAVREVMGVGEMAEGRRRRAKELGEMAKRAMEKGGSSHQETDELIEELKKDRRMHGF